MSIHSSICQVSITEEVLAFLEDQAKASPNRETGGIVAGSGLAEDGTATILKASDGGSRALRQQSFFSRDTTHCQQLVDEWAVESGGMIDYLGEWHKHLEDDPTPSRQDVRTLRDIARSPDYHVRLPLLLIIGRDNLRSSLRVFAITVNGLCLSFNWTLWTGC